MGSVAALPRKTTFSDLERLPEDGRRFELYDGEVWEMTAPTFVHQRVLLYTAMVLEEYARRDGGAAVIAPFDIVFSDYDVVQPDVVYFRPERIHLLKPRATTRVRPDIAVEILSPSTKSNDRGRKLRMFERYGVPEYWIIDGDDCTLEILSLEGEHYRTVRPPSDKSNVVISPLFPDLRFMFITLFDRLWSTFEDF
jgi:Uma2 family endonuclease